MFAMCSTRSLLLLCVLSCAGLLVAGVNETASTGVPSINGKTPLLSPVPTTEAISAAKAEAPVADKTQPAVKTTEKLKIESSKSANGSVAAAAEKKNNSAVLPVEVETTSKATTTLAPPAPTKAAALPAPAVLPDQGAKANEESEEDKDDQEKKAESDVQKKDAITSQGENKDAGKVASENKLPQNVLDDIDSVEDSHFVYYLLFFGAIVALLYIFAHNKKKILGLVVEGRKPRGNSRRSAVHYRRLSQREDGESSSFGKEQESGVIY